MQYRSPVFLRNKSIYSEFYQVQLAHKYIIIIRNGSVVLMNTFAWYLKIMTVSSPTKSMSCHFSLHFFFTSLTVAYIINESIAINSEYTLLDIR